MSETPDTPSPRRPRSSLGFRIVLIASLALNLLLIGVMVGGVLRFAHRPPMPGAGTDYRSLWSALPSEARSALRDEAQRVHGDRPPRRNPEERRARVARQNAQIIAMLRADPFDAAGFAQLLSQERAQVTRRLQAARQAFVEQVEGLSAAQRQAMAAQLQRAWENRLPPR